MTTEQRTINHRLCGGMDIDIDWSVVFASGIGTLVACVVCLVVICVLGEWRATLRREEERQRFLAASATPVEQVGVGQPVVLVLST